MRYDASKSPDPVEWLELDESDRLDLVKRYHIRAKLPVGENERVHAAVHVIVENQVAMGDATVAPATLARCERVSIGTSPSTQSAVSCWASFSMRRNSPVSRSTSTRRMAASYPS